MGAREALEWGKGGGARGKGEGEGEGEGRGRGVRLGRERGWQVVVVVAVVGGEVEFFSQREALLHVNEMLGGIDPHGLCGRRADLYVPLSNRFSFEAKLVEHSEVEQAACTTLK